jgi:hypothetical protein
VADIGVVYLYRFADGETPVRNFLDSYRAHPAGLEHDLHVIFKGFPDQRSLASARAVFGGLPINSIELEDTGYDIGSYVAAAYAVSNCQLIFFNTFSQILVDNWLSYYNGALNLPRVGLVGATGSWQAHSSGYEAAIIRVLHRILHPLDYFNKRRGRAAGENQPVKLTRPAAGRVLAKDIQDYPSLIRILRNLFTLMRVDVYLFYLYEYGRYPNPHIRTNAFMIRRDRFLSLRTGSFRTKQGVYKFESGRRSMTKQIVAQGLRPVVVDRSGKVHDIPKWRSSLTFWVNDQDNLVVADNRTRDYAMGSPAHRNRLENNAWDHPSAWKINRS